MSSAERISAAERLAQLILPHAAPLDYGGTDHDRLTFADAAGALAGLTDEQALLARVVWFDDYQHFRALERATWLHVVEHVVVPQRWADQVTIRGHHYWRRMALLALCELVWPLMCPACHGRGRVWTPRPAACELCGTSGRVKYTVGMRARLVGMSPRHWQRWQTRYLQHVRPIPFAWLAEAESHVEGRLRRARTVA